MKSFETWLVQDLKTNFGIVRDDSLMELTDWLQADYAISEETKNYILKLQKRIYLRIEMLSEADIKVYLIHHLIELINFWAEEYRGFYEYTLSTQKINVKGIEIPLKGRVEMLVAKGEQIAENPFFFFNEYKPQIPSSKNDPQGQLLSTMIAAQVLNNDNSPIYGCYVIGKLWQFVVLKGNKYAVSNSYNAMNQDIMKIYSLLMDIKCYIHKQLNLALPENVWHKDDIF